MYRYHPHYGFITNDTKQQKSDITYKCNFTRNGVSFMKTIEMNVEPYIEVIPKPILEEISGGHTVVGQRLTLECKVKAPSLYLNINWMTPSGPPDLKRMTVPIQENHRNEETFISRRLIINQTTLTDQGTYLCNVSSRRQGLSSINHINVTIYAPNEHFINITNNYSSISEMAGKDGVVEWRLTVNGHPEPKLFWLNNRNETIPNNENKKYEVKSTQTEAILKIKNISITDYGNYTLLAQNDFETQTRSLFLNVTDKPSVHLESDNVHMVKQNGIVFCKVVAHPIPDIYWSFKPCLDNSCEFLPINETKSSMIGVQVTSYVNIESKSTGNVKCLARNSIGEDHATLPYYLTDVRNGFDIFGFDETVNVSNGLVEIGVGEPLKMICGVSVYNYSADIKWIRNDTMMTIAEGYRIDKSSTEYSHRLILNIARVNFSDSGTYSCKVKTKSGALDFKNITLVVSNFSKPEFTTTNMTRDKEITLPNRIDFLCKVKGVPKPKVTWFRNNERLSPSNRTIFEDDGQRIRFTFLEFHDEGTYKCEASNKAGKVSKQINLKIKNKQVTNNTYLYVIIFGLAALAVISVLIVVLKLRNEKKLQRELRIAGLANFEKGAIESLNPELAIDDQAELLPYDKKWEFPIEKLKLGKQLGSGAFGVVMKGMAKGIVDGEESTTVAVKMVKKNAEHIYIKALASELKIMVHLGKHLNVVNLLGACTKNVVKRELLVIVEFCRFGNLQNYLLRHRENFIDQIDPKTLHIDYTIGQEMLERSYSASSNRSNMQSPMKYAVFSFSNSNENSRMIDYRGDNYNGATTATTDITLVSSSGDDDIILSNNSSIQPEWRCNYLGDYNYNIQPICTKNLIAWAFQVSRGMEYLASRRVLHGDLAARNILLADNNVVKICDFGLAKSMYKSDNYKKKGNGPLPMKWMAIESIRDKVFSTQSDVWSFGIVLWEFFSLARTPYPGMEADEKLYNKLLDGYRMEAPNYAPKEIYKMMLDCWVAKPTHRPSFSKLSQRIGCLLEDSVRKHYIDLNDPYLLMNTQRLENGHSDYLTMLSPPNFENLSSPHHYSNDLPPTSDTPGYLDMNSAHIFSPRSEDNRVFSFDINDKKPEEDTGNELVPNSESDCDSLTCNSLANFSNPSYHLPPIVDKEQNKNALRDSNPILDKIDSERCE